MGRRVQIEKYRRTELSERFEKIIAYFFFSLLFLAFQAIRYAGVVSFNPQGDRITLEEASVSIYSYQGAF